MFQLYVFTDWAQKCELECVSELFIISMSVCHAHQSTHTYYHLCLHLTLRADPLTSKKVLLYKHDSNSIKNLIMYE